MNITYKTTFISSGCNLQGSYYLIGITLNTITIAIRLEQQHHFIRKSRLLTIQKVTSKELYWILVRTRTHKPTSQKYFEKKFSDLCINWGEIYMTPQIVSSNTYTRCFQYKVLSNALFLNKKKILFQKSSPPLRSFCKEKDETVFHLYFYCPNVRNL